MIVVSTGPSGRVCNPAAWAALQSGALALDAVQAGLAAAESDPTCDDIGYGGGPDANGVMSLDAAIMDGRTHRAGSVAGLLGCKNPILVARQVLEKTPHVLLVGAGARAFATAQGFPDEGALLTPEREAEYAAFLRGEVRPAFTGEVSPSSHDTVGCCALGADGNLAVGCSTSGLAYKMPGRVGDSPILGAGLYVENAAGAATCMGMGEQMMQVCLAFRVVAAMERGLSPTDACAEGIRALRAKRPHVQNMTCLVLALAKSGETGAAATAENVFFYQTDSSGERRVIAPVV